MTLSLSKTSVVTYVLLIVATTGAQELTFTFSGDAKRQHGVIRLIASPDLPAIANIAKPINESVTLSFKARITGQYGLVFIESDVASLYYELRPKDRSRAYQVEYNWNGTSVSFRVLEDGQRSLHVVESVKGKKGLPARIRFEAIHQTVLEIREVLIISAGK